jgi:hypothetical protein
MLTGINAQKTGDIGKVVVVLISDGRANVPMCVSMGEEFDPEADENSKEGKPSRAYLKDEVIACSKKLGSLPGFNLLCIDTESKFISTGLTKDIADAAMGIKRDKGKLRSPKLKLAPTKYKHIFHLISPISTFRTFTIFVPLVVLSKSVLTASQYSFSAPIGQPRYARFFGNCPSYEESRLAEVYVLQKRSCDIDQTIIWSAGCFYFKFSYKNIYFSSGVLQIMESTAWTGPLSSSQIAL